MSTKAKRHVHKYHKIPLGSTPVWACALSDCNHYMPKHLESMITMGTKASICWVCGNEFVLKGDALNMDKPICDKCNAIVTEMGESPNMTRDSLLDRTRTAVAEAKDIIAQSDLNKGVERQLCTKCGRHYQLQGNPDGWCYMCFVTANPNA